MTAPEGTVAIVVDGREVRAAVGISVAAALMTIAIGDFRRSVRNEPRGPLCGMGICHECRVTIDGVAHRRACLTVVANGQRIATMSDM